MKKVDAIRSLPSGLIQSFVEEAHATPIDDVEHGGSRQKEEEGPVNAPDIKVPSAEPGLRGLERFRLSQNFGAAAPVKKLLTTVPVRKPHNQEFIRTSTTLTFETLTFSWKDDNRIFLVEPDFAPLFSEPLRPTILVGTSNRQGIFFLWPIFLQQGDEPWNDWHRSAYDAMSAAQSDWVRVASNRALGAYEAHQALAALPEPSWPELDLMKLLEIAFRDQVVDGPDHVIVRKLRGEV